MKKLVATSALALILGSAAAQAGSLAPLPAEPVLQTPAPAPAPMPSVRNWTGAYGGVQLGAQQSRFGLNGPVDSGALRFTDLNGGLYGGFNWQGASNMVYGVEADVAAARGSNSTTIGADTIEARQRGSASLRARAGYAMGDTLFYAAAGVSHARFGIDTGTGNDSQGRTGWTAGIGVEQAFSNSMSGRLELRHADYGSFTSGAYEGRLRSNEVRAGVAFHF